ncbi:hypothetical protein JZ751_027439 [Albula glossodonta]|uniref:Uncharacterized protein n=1 Tax=Albula glossodonta TaxID=121402 RepID=A0A8T2NC48_9TELE|nr:hypothetical protein JZ751_027439 [Albula glossodonta]
MDSCLDDLWSKLRVVQYLSQRNEEPSLKIVELQQQMREWVKKNRTQKPCAKALVIITMDSDSARAIIVKSLSHITDVLVSAVLPEDSGSKLDCRRVKERYGMCSQLQPLWTACNSGISLL